MNELALFAGSGGGILGGKLLGWRTMCAVEINAFCARRLMQRQNEGHLPPFPVWDNVCTFDGRPWRGVIDVVSAGFPCQDISAVGGGAGIDGERSGLWSEVKRIIHEVGPDSVQLENSPMLTSRGLGRVLGDLAALGYDAEWGVLGAYHAGASHERERWWLVAHSNRNGLQRRDCGDSQRYRHRAIGLGAACLQSQVWPDVSDPRTFGSADGVAHRVDRLRAIGNGQVPAVAKLAWEILAAE